MLKIYSCEAEKIIVLIDVESMEEREWINLFASKLNEDEIDIVGNLAFEGSIVSEKDDIADYETEEKKLEDYISELKQFCKVCLEESEE